MKKDLKFSSLSLGRKIAVVVGGSVQVALAAAAWADLAKRPAAEINGPKPLWAAVIAVNWIGPIAYFVRGRRQDG
ncbi:PLDc N-terminal domain-containing protein [Mycetocola zhujimingii]|uniref:Cardiolipin synthase N-terminal domain-containing protein n=1 Tax=Mycetocola zhujimingii TaxID=2079792 RepID=A0A2U1THI9_9MICO|nr:PLDc N-terminal domain-containing protein [Mycetocola zhujimingii]AWB86816.1 hypothetical protein C3E77_09415 [Mycetocola zhujimingii]PWC08364.1 hypothetical protein DF223_03235 [Mycetocola zhujimingii]